MGLKNRVSDLKSFVSLEQSIENWDQARQASFIRCLFQSSGNIFFVLDFDGRFININKGAEILFGLGQSELIGRYIYEYVDESEKDKLTDYISCLSQEKDAFGKFSFMNAEGSLLTCKLCFHLWRDENNQDLGIVVTGQDVSSWSQFQEDLVQIDRLAEIGRMTAGIVHELKNPLSIINQAAGWAGVLVHDAKGMNDRDQEELFNTLKEVEEQTSRCKNITSKVLDFVRGTEPEKKHFDIQDLLHQTIKYMEPELRFPPIDVVTFFSKESIVVDSDFKLLQQVFVNLMSNAIYAIRDADKRDGTIEISIENKDAWTKIFVNDNGLGIPEHKQDKIFELFYTTKPVGKGTGLGLPISRNILYKLGGDLSFESKQNQGTSFIVTLPK